MTIGQTSTDGRRLVVTVVFIDFVASTELAGRLDPEDLRDHLRTFVRLCRAPIAAHGGTVTNVMGDGVLAVFGAPISLEDAPVRAVRAALEAVGAVAGMPPAVDGTRGEARAGVHTGECIVTWASDDPSRLEVDLVGETVNLSARLQTAAPPGGVLVSDVTARAVAGFIDLLEEGALELKGIARPVLAHRALASTGAADRIEARDLLPMVGRDAELVALLDAAGSAATGRSRVVVIAGDAGLGKSRLVAEARTRPPLAGAPVHVWRGVLDHADTPWAAVRAHRAGAAAVVVDEVLAGDTGTAEDRRARAMAAARAAVVEQARSGFAVLLAEDRHWFDPTSAEVLEGLIAEPLDVPLLVLVTTREIRSLAGAAAPHQTDLQLEALADADVCELVARAVLLYGQPFDDGLVRRVADRAAGVPLFVEEFVRASTTVALDGVPATLRGLLQARLESVGIGLEVAQVCSVLGPEVDRGLLAAVLDLDDDALGAPLQELVSAGLMEANGHIAFRHVLVRETAYDTLLRSDRRRLHQRAADVLRERFAERAARRPEELARHQSAAGAHADAVESWARAGSRAVDHHALAEAIAHFDRAMEALAQLPEEPARDARELDLLLAIGPAVYRHRGGGDARMVELYGRAEELAGAVDDPAQRFNVLQLLYAHWTAQAEHGRAEGLGNHLVELADASGSTTLRILAHSWVGSDRALAGDLDGAADHLALVVELYDPTRRPRVELDPGVLAKTFLGIVDLARGDRQGAVKWFADAQAIAAERGPFTRAWCCQEQAKAHALVGDVDDADALARNAAAAADEHGFAQIEPQARAVLGWVAATRGDAAGGAATIVAALDDHHRSGSVASTSAHFVLAARAHRLAGDEAAATAALAAARAFVDRTGERLYVALAGEDAIE